MTTLKWTAEERLAVLEEAEERGNVAAVCRRHGISRKTFCKWKRRHEEEGLEGLHDRSRAPHRQVPRRRSGERMRQVQQHALEHPGQTLREMARALGVSKSTVQAILKDIDLSTPSQRWEWLERLARRRSEKWQPSEEQLRFLAGMNPAWHDCSLNRLLPGLLSPWQMGICQHQRPWFVCIHTYTGYLLKLHPLPRDGWETAATWRAMLQGIRSELQQWPDPSFLKPPSLGAASRESFGMLQLFEMLLPELMDGDAAPSMDAWNRSEIDVYPFHGNSPQKRMEVILQGKS